MTEVQFCPQCGTRRAAGSHFCISCGHRFEGLLSRLGQNAAAPLAEPRGISPAAAEPTASSAPARGEQAEVDRISTISLIAGLSWIGAALCYGYLAFLQLQYAPVFAGQADELRGLAIANGIGALIVLVIGARLILGAARGTMVGSAIWGGISVLYGAWQISDGVTHEVFLLGTLLSGAAGVLSLVAAQGAPRGADERPVLTPIAKGLLALIALAALFGAVTWVVQR